MSEDERDITVAETQAGEGVSERRQNAGKKGNHYSTVVYRFTKFFFRPQWVKGGLFFMQSDHAWGALVRTPNVVLPRWFSISRAAFLLLFLVTVGIRVAAVDLNKPLGNDEAEYVSLANDYLRTGEFQSTLSRETYGHFMPVAYSFLLAKVADAFHVPPHLAGIAVSLAFGILLVVLSAWATYRTTFSIPIAWSVGVLVALNRSMIHYSVEVFTESVFMCCFLALAILLADCVVEERAWKRWCRWAAAGCVLAFAFLVRAGSLMLFVAVPLTYLMVLAVRQRDGRFRRLAAAVPEVLLCLAIGTVAVLWNAYRLESLNGFFSLSPQIAGNARIGRLVSGLDLDQTRLNEAGTALNLHGHALNEKAAFQVWLESPGETVKNLVVNLRKNASSLYHGGIETDPVVRRIATLVFLFLLALYFLARRSRDLFTPMFGPPVFTQTKESSALAAVLACLIVLHLGASSLFMHWTRYAEQAIPMTIVLMGLVAFGCTGVVRAMASQPDRIVPYLRVIRETRWYFQPRLLGAALVALLVLQASWMAMDFKAKPSQPFKERMTVRIGEAISAQAKAAGVSPRVVSTSMSIPFYAGGIGLTMPYPEERPDRFVRYLKAKSINFAYSGDRIVVGNALMMSIPPHQLLLALAKLYPSSVTEHEPGPFFSIRAAALPLPTRAETPTLVRSETPLNLRIDPQSSVMLLVRSRTGTERVPKPVFPCNGPVVSPTLGLSVYESDCFRTGFIGSDAEVDRYWWAKNDGTTPKEVPVRVATVAEPSGLRTVSVESYWFKTAR